MPTEISSKEWDKFKKLLPDDKGLAKLLNETGAAVKKAERSHDLEDVSDMTLRMGKLQEKLNELQQMVSKAQIEDKLKKDAQQCLAQIAKLNKQMDDEGKKEFTKLSMRNKLKAVFLGKKKVLEAARVKAKAKARLRRRRSRPPRRSRPRSIWNWTRPRSSRKRPRLRNFRRRSKSTPWSSKSCAPPPPPPWRRFWTTARNSTRSMRR
jgi:hypothetical protein